MNLEDIFEPDAIDFYDHKALEKLQEKRARKWIQLFAKAKKGDAKAKEAIRKHEEQDRILRKRASVSGFYWT